MLLTYYSRQIVKIRGYFLKIKMGAEKKNDDSVFNNDFCIVKATFHKC